MTEIHTACCSAMNGCVGIAHVGEQSRAAAIDACSTFFFIKIWRVNPKNNLKNY